MLRTIFRLTNPVAVLFAGRRWLPVWALVVHTGRRTGRTLKTPVAPRRTAYGFVIALPWGRRVSWFRNLEVAGGGVVRWKGVDYPVRDPRTTTWSDLDAFSPRERAILRRARVQEFAVLSDA